MEAELIRRSREGDLDAFNRLVETYQGQVFSLAYRMLGTRAGAEDAAQEAFIAAFRNIKSFRGEHFRAWLLRIATNACYDQLRAAKRHAGSSLDAMLDNTAWEPASTQRSPEDQAISAELGREIQRAIATLPPDQRAVLLLADVEGLSYEEVAEATSANVGTVKSRLARARARVREHFSSKQELLPPSLRLAK
ncbi:MAG: sigma-70 family RNA polymerase sigma factor [Chloroflexi bacterium]|nr:sigma-70 family RNA polymerase sigma factor [Chloroflexota bacterium]